ncbi:hypothetical protein BGX38DRAFT_1264796 [Terfezia claveryi]|nr:hypothetical protein BGX38DRAFT_1264796 [Terfezia claveryi]
MAPCLVVTPSASQIELQKEGQEEGDNTSVELGFRNVGPVEPLGYNEQFQTLEMSNKREEPVPRQSSEISTWARSTCTLEVASAIGGAKMDHINNYTEPLPKPVDIGPDGRPICSLEPSDLQRVDGTYSAVSMNATHAQLIALESERVPHRLCGLTRNSRCLWMVVALIVVLVGAAIAGAVYATQGNKRDTGKSEPIALSSIHMLSPSFRLVLPSIGTPDSTMYFTTIMDSNVIPNQPSISPTPTVDLQPPSVLKTGDYYVEQPLKQRYDGYCRNLNETDPLSVARCLEIKRLNLTIGRGTAEDASIYWVQYQLGTLVGKLNLVYHPEERSFQSVTGNTFKQQDFYQNHIDIYREEEVQDSGKTCFYHKTIDHFVFKDESGSILSGVPGTWILFPKGILQGSPKHVAAYTRLT